jgi:hypothetical protein
LTRTAGGNGSTLSGQAKALIKQARPGSTILFETDVRGPDGLTKRKNGSFTVK